jgi:hypothetical protein
MNQLVDPLFISHDWDSLPAYMHTFSSLPDALLYPSPSPPLQIHTSLIKMELLKWKRRCCPKKKSRHRYGQTASVSRMIVGHPLPAIRKMQRTVKILHKSAMLRCVTGSIPRVRWRNQDVTSIFTRFFYSNFVLYEVFGTDILLFMTALSLIN